MRPLQSAASNFQALQSTLPDPPPSTAVGRCICNPPGTMARWAARDRGADVDPQLLEIPSIEIPTLDILPAHEAAVAVQVDALDNSGFAVVNISSVFHSMTFRIEYKPIDGRLLCQLVPVMDHGEHRWWMPFTVQYELTCESTFERRINLTEIIVGSNGRLPDIAVRTVAKRAFLNAHSSAVVGTINITVVNGSNQSPVHRTDSSTDPKAMTRSSNHGHMSMSTSTMIHPFVLWYMRQLLEYSTEVYPDSILLEMERVIAARSRGLFHRAHLALMNLRDDWDTTFPDHYFLPAVSAVLMSPVTMGAVTSERMALSLPIRDQ
eukprot:gene29187-37658_t